MILIPELAGGWKLPYLIRQNPSLMFTQKAIRSLAFCERKMPKENYKNETKAKTKNAINSIDQKRTVCKNARENQPISSFRFPVHIGRSFQLQCQPSPHSLFPTMFARPSMQGRGSSRDWLFGICRTRPSNPRRCRISGQEEGRRSSAQGQGETRSWEQAHRGRNEEAPRSWAYRTYLRRFFLNLVTASSVKCTQKTLKQ